MPKMPKFEQNLENLIHALHTFQFSLLGAIHKCNEEEIRDKQFLEYALHHLLFLQRQASNFAERFVNPIVKHLSADNPGGKADFVARYGPNEHDVNRVAELFARFRFSYEAYEALGATYYGTYQTAMNLLMRYLHWSDGLSPRDIDVRVYLWLVKYKLIDCTNRHPRRTAKRGLQFLWMLCGGKENFGRILYATVPTEGWPWVADEAKETRTRNQAMEDRVWESSRSPSGLPYDVRMNIAGMLA